MFQEWSSYYFKENIVLLYKTLSIYSAPYMLFHFVFVLWKIILLQSFLQNLMLSILGFLVSSIAFTWRNRYPRNAFRGVMFENYTKSRMKPKTMTIPLRYNRLPRRTSKWRCCCDERCEYRNKYSIGSKTQFVPRFCSHSVY